MSTTLPRSMRRITSACAHLGRAYWLLSAGRPKEAEAYIGRALFHVHEARKWIKRETAQK